MKWKVLILPLLLQLHLASTAQTMRFNNVYDLFGTWDHASSVIVEYDGYFITGTSAGFSGSNRKLALLKIDLAGNLLWTKVFGVASANYWDNGYSECFIKTQDSGYVFSGKLETTTGYDVVLTKFDAIGDTIWQRTFGDPTLDWFGSQCKQTTDKGFIIVGSQNVSLTNADLLLIKTDSLGNFQWKKNIDYTQESGSTVICTQDGGFLIGGVKQSGANNYGWIVKTDNLGNLIWQKGIGGTYGSSILNIAPTLDNNYIATGFIENSTDGSYSAGKGIIMKLDTLGNIIWQKTYGREGTGSGFTSIKALSDSTFVVSGTQGSSLSSGYEINAFIIKINALGDSVWSREFDKYSGAGRTDAFNTIKPTQDGGFIVAGDFYPLNQDMWVVKVDSLGCDVLGCQFVSVIEKSFVDEIRMYPNPAKDIVTFDVTDLAVTIRQMVVFDIVGNKIQTIDISSPSSLLRLNLRPYKRGIYFIQLISENGSTFSKKIILI